jgi:hypothetical protein
MHAVSLSNIMDFSFSRKFPFSRKFSLNFRKIFAKIFAKTDIFAKRNFAKIVPFSHFSENWKMYFRYNWSTNPDPTTVDSTSISLSSNCMFYLTPTPVIGWADFLHFEQKAMQGSVVLVKTWQIAKKKFFWSINLYRRGHYIWSHASIFIFAKMFA